MFAEVSDPESLVEPVESLLRDEDHRTDLEALEELPVPVLITPALEGWVAITGAGAWISDLSWAAEQLSGTLGDGRVASCEIFGNCFRLRLGEYRSGEEQCLLRTPEHGWTDDRGEPDQMPLYEDVEELAFNTLRKVGVPAPLVTVGTRPLGASTDQDLQDLGEGITLRPSRDRGEVERDEQQLRVSRFEGDITPVLPGSVGEGLVLNLFDDRYVEGAPNDATVDRLVQLEETLLERAKQTRPDDKVDLTMTYYGGVHQDELDALLRVRDHYTPPSSPRDRPAWWAFWRYFGRVR